MIFTADTKEFIAALAIAGRVVPAKSPWPILLNIKIATNDNRVTLIGSDADTTFEAEIAARVETEGVHAIPFAPLATFCKAAKGTEITVAVADGVAKISSGRGRMSLICVPVEDFPHYRPPEGDPVPVDVATFCSALRFCAPASEDSEVRHHISGVNFREDVGHVEMFATNGKVMHSAALPELPEIGGGGTLPIATAQTVLAILDKAETASFMICDRGWHAATQSVRVWGKVIGTEFPNVRAVLKQFSEWRDVCVGAASDFSAAINVATCGAESDSDKARILVIRSEAGNPIVIRGKKAIGGVMHAGRAEMDATGKADFAASINSQYLSAAIAGMSGGDICLRASGRDDMPAVDLRPAQADHAVTISALIMGTRSSEAELADV